MLMNNLPVKIVKIKKDGNDIKTFYLDKKMPHTKPGRFFQFWLPDYGKKPLSITETDPYLASTVRRIKHEDGKPLSGRFTNRLFELKEGDYVSLSGPLGNGFDVDRFNNRDVILVGGGTGIAVLALLNKRLHNSKVQSFLGAKTRDEVIMEERFNRPYITTDDGSYGEKGFVTDAMNRYDFEPIANPRTRAAICGPEVMMDKAAKILEQYIPAENIYVCVERMIKCGIGICGSCDFGGYRLCVDGPVFQYSVINDLEKGVPDFGVFKRGRSGRKEYFNTKQV